MARTHLVALFLLTVSLTAQSQQVSLEGYFIAFTPCEANKKKDRDNPGNVRLEEMRAYEMIARNATPGTYYQVKVPAAPVTEVRWVPMDCGAFAPRSSLLITGGPSGGIGDPLTPGDLAPDSIELVLAVSWQPGFCATAGQGKRECATQTPDRFDATHFSLHGLWPDDLDDKQIFPCYCDRGAPIGCRRSQERDSDIELSDAVFERLEVVMPGVQSGLHLHEWPKHGSCYEDNKSGPDAGADPDEYFTESIAVLEALNASAVRTLFAANIGETLSREEIETAFDQAFGQGASERVLIRCKKADNEYLITELWISLKGDISEPTSLSKLILEAPPTGTSTDLESCAEGHVAGVDP